MGPFDSCRLIHINLTSLVKNGFMENAEIDLDKAYEIGYEVTRISDDLVDLEMEAVERIIKKNENDSDCDSTEKEVYTKILDNAKYGRRCGIGITGLADMLAMLGLKYDSDEALEVVDKVMSTIFKGELDSEIDLGLERGTFEGYNKELEQKGNSWYSFVRENYQDEYEKMMEYGRRHVSFTTVAPCGTISIMTRTSSGIEPVFMPYYKRRRKCMSAEDRVDFIDRVGEKYTEFFIVHPGLEKWVKTHYSDVDYSVWKDDEWKKAYEESPYFGATAGDIDWNKRILMQGTVQKYITHALSSTINLPKGTTEEEVSSIYETAWRKGLKGLTIYVDGSRDGVIVQADSKEKAENKICIANQPVPKRPKEVPCKIYRFNNKGERWIGVVGLVDGKPYEIFTGLLEKLAVPNWVEDGFIVRNKEKHLVDGEEKLVSRYDICYIDKNGERTCVEGLSRTFNPEYWNYAKLISGLLRHRMPITYVIKVISSLNLDASNINTWKNGVIRTLRKFNDSIPEDQISSEKCPECGGRLVRESGCLHCVDCGYSKCE